MGTLNPDDLQDRRSHAATTAEELQLQILGQIRDSLTVINRKQDALTGKVDDYALRVVRLEERNERIARLESMVAASDAKIDALLKDKDQRDGAQKVFVGFRGWLPVLIAIGAAVASIFSAIYLAGRATGVVDAPPVHVTRSGEGR